MNTDAKLTKRQTEIAEMLAWGASKKDVADQLCISERTVENHTKDIYEETGCGKVNELSAWWFCTHFNISFRLSPLKRKVIACFFLSLILPEIYFHSIDIMRETKTRNVARIYANARKRGREIDDANTLILLTV